jgi:hypothetical protein
MQSQQSEDKLQQSETECCIYHNDRSTSENERLIERFSGPIQWHIIKNQYQMEHHFQAIAHYDAGSNSLRDEASHTPSQNTNE